MAQNKRILKQKYILYLLFLYFIVCACTFNKEQQGNDGKLISNLLNKANNEHIDSKSRLIFTQKALSKLLLQPNDTATRHKLFLVSFRFYNLNDLENYKKVTRIIIKKTQKAKDDKFAALALSNMGDYFARKFVTDSAYYFYFKSQKIYTKLKDKQSIAKCLLNKAILQFNEKDFVGSEKSCFDALRNLRNIENDELKFEANNVLGIIYTELNEFDKALEHNAFAQKIVDNGNMLALYHNKSTSLNNLGMVYQNQNQDAKAGAFFRQAMQAKNLHRDNPFLFAALLDNEGYSNFKQNKLDNLPQQYFESLKIYDSLQIVNNKPTLKIHLSEFYAFKKDNKQAIKYAKEAYNLARENRLPREVLLSLKQLAVVNPKQISVFSSEYIKINDSLQLSERKIRNKLARIEFETDELIIRNKELERINSQIIYLVVVFAFLIVFIYIVTLNMVRKREQLLKEQQESTDDELNQTLIVQKQKIEAAVAQERNSIARELHDGVLGNMFGVRMNLESINHSYTGEITQKGAMFLEQLKQIECEIRNLTHGINNEKALISDNFVIMLNKFLDNQRQICPSEIHCTIDGKINWNKQDDASKINLFRIVQESFQNINKYAQASNIHVQITKESRSIILIIKDDGIGFNYKTKSKGIGLKNMKARIEELSGELTVTSAKNQGTILEFEIPTI